MHSLEAHTCSTARCVEGGAAGGRLWHILISLAAARRGDAVSTLGESAARSDRSAVILSSPAVPVSLLASGTQRRVGP
jgi:hypothetical protein